MSREALKFTDLDAFLAVMEKLGIGHIAHEVIYEKDKLPYCSAYLIPTDLLPASVDHTVSIRFGGTITHVEEINYLGTERFFTDFMIYPLSRTGYQERANGSSAITFMVEKSEPGGMVYVINLEDGGGKEFYMAVGGRMISLTAPEEPEPQEFKMFKLAAKRVEQIRSQYPPVCHLYVLERAEFDNRRAILLKPSTEDTPPPAEE